MTENHQYNFKNLPHIFYISEQSSELRPPAYMSKSDYSLVCPPQQQYIYIVHNTEKKFYPQNFTFEIPERRHFEVCQVAAGKLRQTQELRTHHSKLPILEVHQADEVGVPALSQRLSLLLVFAAEDALVVDCFVFSILFQKAKKIIVLYTTYSGSLKERQKVVQKLYIYCK